MRPTTTTHRARPACHAQLVHRVEPVLCGQRRGSSCRPLPAPAVVGGPGQAGRVVQGRLDLLRRRDAARHAARRLRPDLTVEQLVARLRSGRLPEGDRLRDPGGEHRRHAGALQPPGRAQAGQELDGAPHGPAVDTAAPVARPGDESTPGHPVPGGRDGAIV